MNRNSTSSMGALHPVLFFLLIYVISLLLAVYVCRTAYHAIYGEEPTVQTQLNTNNNITATATVDY